MKNLSCTPCGLSFYDLAGSLPELLPYRHNDAQRQGACPSQNHRYSDDSVCEAQEQLVFVYITVVTSASPDCQLYLQPRIPIVD